MGNAGARLRFPCVCHSGKCKSLGRGNACQMQGKHHLSSCVSPATYLTFPGMGNEGPYVVATARRHRSFNSPPRVLVSHPKEQKLLCGSYVYQPHTLYKSICTARNVMYATSMRQLDRRRLLLRADGEIDIGGERYGDGGARNEAGIRMES